MKTQSFRSGVLSGAPPSNSRGSTARALPKQKLRYRYMSNKMSMGVGLMRTIRFVSSWAITITLAQALFLWLPAQAEAGSRVRKNYTTLTAAEKARFIDACILLKATDPGMTDPNVVGWNDIVKMHLDLFYAGIHRGPTFLAWHRDLLLRLEDALRATPGNADVTIPYWDWTLNTGFPADLANFVGGNGDPFDNYIVKTGPFAHSTGNWNITVDQCCNFGPYGGLGSQLKRSFGFYIGSLPTGPDVDAVIAVGMESIFDTCPWNASSIGSFRNRLEGFIPLGAPPEAETHNRVHVWTGGNMLIGGSPNDPLFFMHHANVDRIWCQWQAAHPYAFHHLPSGGGTCFDHPPPAACPPLAYDKACTDMNLDDLFGPPNRRPVDVLNMQALGFEYDDCVGPCQHTTFFAGLTLSQAMILHGL